MSMLLLGVGVGGAGVTEPSFPSLTGLKGRWKANSLVLNNNDPVANWTDQSASGYTLSQSTEANKPLYKSAPTGFNSWPALYFDGTNDTLTRAQNALDVVSATAGIIYVVFRADTLDADSGSPWTNNTLFHSGIRIGLHAYTSNIQSFNYDGTNDVINTTISTGTTYLGIWRHTGGNLGVALNNGAFTETASGNSQNGNVHIDVGATPSGGYFEGHIAEVIVCNNYDATEFADVKTYINSKYAIW